ncbi:TES1 Peroxisomal acyl-coenzyme A thioester hydrolase 1 [Candida maltosa Xu316]|uniref:Peroxisomal Acyl-CoA thioesterase Tes1p, putative n=1 Tax=Candida maltosa (strain Xu316) TaxID=1245528 RepID=M3HSY3_CANMX|nr:Peroxisomal Acyl-CoA thioesterase Tes1p, putative [Candida maltosa Xu316]
MELSAGPNPLPDLEEALRVIQIDETHYVGAHPLRKPVTGSRGVYGGHTIAQSLLVGIESTRDPITKKVFIPDSYHSYFINAGDAKVPMNYTVTKLYDDENMKKRFIVVEQKGKTRLTCLVSLRKPGTKPLHGQSNLDISIPVPKIQLKYPNPDELHQVQHTDFVRNAFGKELMDFRECPEENNQYAAERWLTVFSGITNHPEPGATLQTVVEELPDATGTMHKVEKQILRPKDSSSVRDPMYNYIGLADLSDSAFLTTMARVLHIPWAPSLEIDDTYDDSRDATIVMRSTLNAAHIFHYNAMSLDHHIYFHNDDYTPDDDSKFDICKDWLAFTYQMKRLSNNRTLVRGYLFNENHRCIATVVQEGLTIIYNGVGKTADKSRL